MRARVSLRRIVTWRRAGGGLALALAVSALAQAEPERRGARALTGQLLVATPGMTDPRFARTVIYVVHHDASGALGLVVNRSSDEVPIALLLDRLGQEHAGASGSMRMHYGGPVEPGRIFVLHTTDWRTDRTHVIGGGIALTAPSGVLRAIAAGGGPRQALLALGYSGWGPGQLEREIRAGGWSVAPATSALVFDGDDEAKWQRALPARTPGSIDL